MIKELGLETSTSNARRVIEQGGFNIGPHREPITDPKALDLRLRRLDRPGRQAQDRKDTAGLSPIGPALTET